MKKILVILMILTLSLSVFSCKRHADSDIAQLIIDSDINDTAENEETTQENFAPSAETEDLKETNSDSPLPKR